MMRRAWTWAAGLFALLSHASEGLLHAELAKGRSDLRPWEEKFATSDDDCTHVRLTKSTRTQVENVRRNIIENKTVHEVVTLQRRPKDALVLDFFQFFNESELPLLRLRLAEMGDLVDEIHIAEGDRDFKGFQKPIVFDKLMQSDPVLMAWKHKMHHHAVKVDPSKRAYNIQHQIIDDARAGINQSGVLIDGDLDEIICRPLLRALRACEPVGGLGWDARVSMDMYRYNLAWNAGNWGSPPVVHDYTPESNLGLKFYRRVLQGKREHGLSGAAAGDAARDVAVGGDADHWPQYNRHRASGQSVERISGSSGNTMTAGWHLGWMLDAHGFARKLLQGHIEKHESWNARWLSNHSSSESELATFIEKEVLPDPGSWDPTVHHWRPSNPREELPEAFSEQPGVFSDLLGDIDVHSSIG